MKEADTINALAGAGAGIKGGRDRPVLPRGEAIRFSLGVLLQEGAAVILLKGKRVVVLLMLCCIAAVHCL